MFLGRGLMKSHGDDGRTRILLLSQERGRAEVLVVHFLC